MLAEADIPAIGSSVTNGLCRVDAERSTSAAIDTETEVVSVAWADRDACAAKVLAAVVVSNGCVVSPAWAAIATDDLWVSFADAVNPAVTDRVAVSGSLSFAADDIPACAAMETDGNVACETDAVSVACCGHDTIGCTTAPGVAVDIAADADSEARGFSVTFEEACSAADTLNVDDSSWMIAICDDSAAPTAIDAEARIVSDGSAAKPVEGSRSAVG